MKQKYNHKPRPHKSPSTGSQPTASAAAPDATKRQAARPQDRQCDLETTQHVPRFVPVTDLPGGWNAQQDREYFKSIHGERKNPHRYILGHIEKMFRGFTAAIDQAIRHFQKKDGINGAPGALAVPEKIERLRELVHASSSPDKEYHARFGSFLDELSRTEKERSRVLALYQRHPQGLWLRVLSDLADSLLSKAVEVEEMMMGEHTDYNERLLNFTERDREILRPPDQGQPLESPNIDSHAHGSVTPYNEAGPQTQEPSAKALRWYYEHERSVFLPIKPPPDWNEAKDKQEYIDNWGASDDYWRDTAAFMKEDLAEVHAVLDSGINYFASKRGAPLLVSLSKLNLLQKVALFTELLPASANRDYTLRFSINLARILWLESERERITQCQDISRWLFPFYHVADSLFDAACELKESLRCEHDDYHDPGIDEEADRPPTAS